ncbi:MAG: MBOAT family O-acyltransferase [Myxococcota bacterium]
MDFDSLEFFVFVGFFFLLWPLARRNHTVRWTFLVAMSLGFYSWGYFRYLPVLLGTGFVDYLSALGMERWPHQKKKLLWASMAANLGMLGFFKYSDFVLSNVNAVTGLFGVAPVPYLHLELPLGISFYTFESMSYTIDVYRGRFKPIKNVLKFYAFLSLFIRLAAGPIVRAAQFIPQLDAPRRPSPVALWNGLRLIVYGFVKKLVIADNLAEAVDGSFNALTVQGGTAHWCTIALFTAVQIYCDFSGYSDIARGLGKWMGFELPVNFNHPFAAPTITKAWMRWHMSLVTWLRDYVYYPLAGNLRNETKNNIAMAVTMLASGLWHGASWTFVIWGAWNAFFLWIERATKWTDRVRRYPGGPALRMFVTAVTMVLGSIWFRAGHIDRAVEIFEHVLSFNMSGALSIPKTYPMELFLVFFVIGRALFFELGTKTRIWKLRRRTRYYTEPVELAILIAMAVFLRGPGHAFVYFQF